jgi:ferredoxin
MAHLTLKDSYRSLAERLNRFPQGAPPTELLFRILKVLFSEQEAALVAQLPIRPFTAAAAARIWRLPEARARAVLETLAGRGMLLDLVAADGDQVFVLPPPMAGFFEFSMMRIGNGYDQQLLAELFHEYMNVEEDFIRQLFTGGATRPGRTFVNEPAVDGDRTLRVLDYERASEVIRSASAMGIGTCYCRHKLQHLGRACAAPLDICMTFNGTARSLIRHGVARAVTVGEGLDLLEQARGLNLVQFGENVRQQVSFICNCCGCCCEAMLAAKRFGSLNPIATTNFLPALAAAACSGCGRCVEVCPVAAMALVSAGDPRQPRRRKARLDPQVCLGCGVCTRVCGSGALSLQARPARLLTPVTTAHRVVLMAIERGTLQHLIFDQRAHWNHRAMAAILGVILKLPPVQQLLASRQLRSRYLERLLGPDGIRPVTRA